MTKISVALVGSVYCHLRPASSQPSLTCSHLDKNWHLNSPSRVLARCSLCYYLAGTKPCQILVCHHRSFHVLYLWVIVVVINLLVIDLESTRRYTNRGLNQRPEEACCVHCGVTIL